MSMTLEWQIIVMMYGLTHKNGHSSITIFVFFLGGGARNSKMNNRNSNYYIFLMFSTIGKVRYVANNKVTSISIIIAFPT